MRYFYAPNASHPLLRGIKFDASIQLGGVRSGVFRAKTYANGLGSIGVREISEQEYREHGGVLENYTEPVVKHPLTAQPPKAFRSRSEQEQRMNETSKAMRRRHCEEADGGFKWSKIFTGKGIDVGAGGDPVQIPGCKPFDMHDGDANHLSRYVEKESLDYIHASQVLEHMHNPRLALLDWATCVKPGGHLVVSVPSWTLYEKCRWGSTFNPDHKSAWSMELRADPRCPVLVHIPTFNADMARHGLKVIICRLVDTNYDYLAPDHIDQTWEEDAGVECFYETVFQK